MQVKELTPRYAKLAAAIEAKLSPRPVRLPTTTGELGYEIAAADLIEHASLLRDDAALKFEMLIDVCGVDYSAYGYDEWQTESASDTGFSRGRLREPALAAAASDTPPTYYEPKARFAAVYHLLSITHNHRLRLKVFCPKDDRPVLDSETGVWQSADWFEREAFDLFGILFRGHPVPESKAGEDAAEHRESPHHQHLGAHAPEVGRHVQSQGSHYAPGHESDRAANEVHAEIANAQARHEALGNARQQWLAAGPCGWHAQPLDDPQGRQG
jgi:NADH-quinone oxidoreductase subunit C